MSPMVIRHGGPNYNGIGDSIAGMIIAKKRMDQDDERFQLTKRRVEQEMDLQEQEEQRRKEQQRWQSEAEGRAAKARQQTPGMIGDMTKAPAQDPNAGESQQFEASIRANTERMGKIAAKIAETDPERGLEYAQRFLEEGEKDLQRLAADRGVTSMLKDIGEAVSTPGTFTVQAGEQAVDDEASVEALKGVMQELETAMGPEVPVQAKIQALDNANKTRQQIRKDLTRRNQQGAAIAAGKNSVATRVAEGGTRLSTVQQGQLGGLMSNIGFEEGMVTPDKVDAEADRILRGTVQVPNPFSFGGGGDMLEMTPESAAKFQESLEKIKLLQAQQGATGALAEQRKSSAGLSDARASGGLTLPKRNGTARGPLADENEASMILKRKFTEGRTKENATDYDKESVRLESKVATANDSSDKLKSDILGKKTTKREAEERARALGLSPEQLKALLGGK